MSIPIAPKEPSSPVPAAHGFVHAQMEPIDPLAGSRVHGQMELDEKPQLCFVAPNGTTTPIRLDNPDYERLMKIFESMNKKPGSCNINFTDALIESDGRESSYSSEEFADHQKEIADLVRKAGFRFPHRFYPTGSDRSPEHATPSFIRKDPRLAALDFGYKKIEKSLGIDEKNPIDIMGEKIDMLKRHQLAKLLLELSEEKIKELGKNRQVPADQAIGEQSRQKKAAEALEVITGVDKFALLFGAIHADLSIQDKQKLALELIQSQDPPKEYKFFHKSINPEAENEYANELALIGIEGRGEYLRSSHSLGSVQKATQAEHFFVALTDRIAKGDSVDLLLTGPLFEKAFGKLGKGDQVSIREMLAEECVKLREVYLAKTLNVADGAKAPTDLPDGRKWEDLFKPPVKPQADSRGKILHDAVQSEMRRLLSDLQKPEAEEDAQPAAAVP